MTTPSVPPGKQPESSEQGAVSDSQLPEDLRPEATDLLKNAEDPETPSGAQAPDDSGLSDNARQHAGQVSEPTTEMAPSDDPGITEPSG